MKERPIIFSGPMVRAILEGRKTQTRRIVKPQPPLHGWKDLRFPYGKPGDRLWVREAWRSCDREQKLLYRADYTAFEMRMGWKSPRFMPRIASRITLEITGVRVEKLASISVSDAKAEGCIGGNGSIPKYAFSATPCEHYRHVWESINGAGSFSENPWVWVIEFRRVE